MKSRARDSAFSPYLLATALLPISMDARFFRGSGIPCLPGNEAGAKKDMNAQKFRILVVEDHVDTAYGLKMYFKQLGHDVRVALDVKSALAAAEESPFDILLSDLLLPDGNGWDLLRQLRSRGPVRAIALSGHNDTEDIARSNDAGFLLHLAKPIAMAELNRVFTEAMESGSTRAGA